MIFVNNISDLWFYNKKADEPCYCEHLVYPNDIILQSVLTTGYTSGFSVQVYVYTPNGVTNLEDASSYFSFYVGVNPSGYKFFNLRCEEFSPAMCNNKCYILRVIVSVSGTSIFDKFTEQYCQTTCCDIPRGITIAPEGTDLTSTVSEAETLPIPYGSCNVPLLRIKAIFECIDNETGLYYGITTSVLTGTANFSYVKITNLTAKIRRAPREIKTFSSYNCNLQRAESFKPWLLQGNSIDAFVPEWKLNELENMLHASYIEVDDFGLKYGAKEYKYAGGTIGERVLVCWDTFRISFPLQDCTVRTDFGCGECDTVSAEAFLIPQGATGDYFYDENRQLIGDYDDLLDYYENLGFTVTETDYDNTYASFTAQGSGVIPNFYYDNLFSNYIVYGTFTPVAPVVLCAMPVLGVIVVEEDICAVPVLGTVVVEDVAEEIADVYSYGNWTVSEDSEVILSEGYGRLFISTTRTYATVLMQIVADTATADITVPDGQCMTVIYGTGNYQRDVDFTQTGNVVTMTNGVTFAIGDDVEVIMNVGAETNPYFANEIIGVIANNGWPLFPVMIETVDYTILIDTSGHIYYTGYPNGTTVGGAQIDISNLYYTL